VSSSERYTPSGRRATGTWSQVPAAPAGRVLARKWARPRVAPTTSIQPGQPANARPGRGNKAAPAATRDAQVARYGVYGRGVAPQPPRFRRPQQLVRHVAE
jgi:hypothetical protein